MKTWEPKDVIAVIIVIGAIALLWQGIDTLVGWTLLGIVAAYYGIDLTPFIHLGRNQPTKNGKETKDNG